MSGSSEDPSAPPQPPLPWGSLQRALKRGFMCVSGPILWEARGWDWPTGQAAGKAPTWGGGQQTEKSWDKAVPSGWGQSKAPPEEDKRTTQVPCSPPPQSGHLIAVVSDMPLCIASVPWEQRAGMVGIPVMGSPKHIRRGLFVEEGSHLQWKGCSKESREKEKREEMSQRFMTLQSPLPGVVGSWVSWSPCLTP